MNRCIFWLVVSLACLPAGVAPLKAQPQETPDPALQLIQRILNDPMLPQPVQGARLELRGWADKARTVSQYAIVPRRGLGTEMPLNTCSIRRFGDGSHNLEIALLDDTLEGTVEPNWVKLAPQWDAFVTRYWPGVQRVSDWTRELRLLDPRLGTFFLRYGLRDQDLEVLTVILEVRLADGKIGGLSVMDARAFVETTLKGKLPPAPARDTVVAAVRQALAKRPDTGVQPRTLRSLERRRYISRDNAGSATFHVAIQLRGRTGQGQPVVIVASYDEARREARIQNVYAGSETDVPRKPATVVDLSPVWSADGQRLYFLTSRNGSWWQREQLIFSLASCAFVDNKGQNFTCLRPVKPLGTDYFSYNLCAPSPTNRYVAATLLDPTANGLLRPLTPAGGATVRNKLFLLDVPGAVVYLPELEFEPGSAPQRPAAGGDALAAEVLGIEWLPNEAGLLISLKKPGGDADLYLARWEQGKVPEKLKLTPVEVGAGNAGQPAISNRGDVLAYVREASGTKSWQLVVADLDAASGKLDRRRILPLAAAATSISWDSANRRWLVVTGGKMLWVNEVRGKLQATPAPPLKWGAIALKPVSAACAPHRNLIVLAAQPSTSLASASTYVVSSLFVWDGRAAQVKPLLEPQRTNLPRWKFGVTGTAWARLRGNPASLNLDIDPAFLFVEQAATASKLNLAAQIQRPGSKE